MKAALRSALTATVGTVAISALTFTPVLLPPAPPPAVEVVSTATGGPLTGASPRLTPEMLRTAAEAIVAAVPSAHHATPTPIPAGAPTPRAKTTTPAPSGSAAGPPAAVVAPANAVSNVIDAVYAVSRYWANYMSLELGPWLINWIPFGYLISDQIYIWYPTFVLPVVDSFVYQFLDPVVNDPLNLGVWLNGISAMINTAIDGVISGISQEINYWLTGGWLPFPLPPLPGAATTATAPTTATLAPGARLTAEAESAVQTPAEQQAADSPPRPRHVVDPATAPPATAVPADITEPDPAPTPADTDAPAEAAPTAAAGTEAATRESDTDTEPEKAVKPARKAPRDRSAGSAKTTGPVKATPRADNTDNTTGAAPADRSTHRKAKLGD